MSDLIWDTAGQLVEGYRQGSLSPVDATKASLDRIETLNGRYGAYTFVDIEGALAQAKASELRWRQGNPLSPFDGVPTSVKDLVLAQDWPCRRGTPLTDPASSPLDAPVVANLRSAGAVLLGKTTTPDFGWKAITDNSLGEIARNPFQLQLTAGGSSGGAAVAAASGMGAWHIGSDGGGSIRIPSAFCGIVGIKPTFGRVPALPLSPFGTVSHLGPMTRTVGDAAAMLEIMARTEAKDWYHTPSPIDWLEGIEADLANRRIAVSRNLGRLKVDDAIARAFEACLSTLSKLGAKIVEIDPPIGQCQELFEIHWYAGAANLLDGLDSTRTDELDQGLLTIARQGQAIDAKTLRHAALERGRVGESMQEFLSEFDLLATPATGCLPFQAGAEVPPGSGFKRWIDWAGFSYPFNLTQQPAIVLPSGQMASGLPIGLQLVAAKYRERHLIGAALALENAGCRFVAPPLG